MRKLRRPSLLLLLSLSLGAAPFFLTGCDDTTEHGDLGDDAGVADLAKPDLTPVVNNDLGDQD